MQTAENNSVNYDNIKRQKNNNNNYNVKKNPELKT